MAFFNFSPASTHSNKLERWLGKDNVEQISRSMRGFHGKSIPVANVPGRVFATTDGDFCGPIKGGYLSSLFEYTLHKIHKAVKKVGSGNRLYTGFASLSDLIAEATVGGKKQTLMFAKSGATGVANKANSLWDLGPQPAAGGTSAAPGGSSPDNTTVGGLNQANATGGDTLHFVSATAVSTVANNLLLLYDRYFQVNHNMTTDPQSVTGVPTRYQSTASKGSFMTAFVTTVLPAATPTYTVTYQDQDGNAAEAASAQTIISAAIARSFPFAATVGNGWFIPLNSGDSGVRKITNLDLSAAMASGFIDVVLCMPYVWIPQGIANFPVIIDGINSAFNLVQIVDNSCLSFMEINKGATTATNYSGTITLVAG